MFLANLPFIPFVTNPDDQLFAFYVLMRMSGLFLIAPLLSNQVLSRTTRSGITLFTTLIIGMSLYPEYRGENPTYILMELDPTFSIGPLGIAIGAAKELAVGYMIGLIFTFVFEALMVSGQIMGVMIGLSMAEILDPVSGQNQSILSQLFAITLSLLVLTMDIHHIFFRIGAESFQILPLGHMTIPTHLIDDISHGSARIFVYSLRFVAFPFSILGLVTIALGFMAKIMPEMNIFMVGFPIRILIGYYAMISGITIFPLVATEAFHEYHNLVVRVLHKMAAG